MRKARKAETTPDGTAGRRRRYSVSRWAGRKVGAESIRAGLDSSRAAYDTAFADEPYDGVTETFAESVRRQGLREADILAAAQRQQITAFANMALVAVVGGAALYNLLAGLVTLDRWSLFYGAASLCIAGLIAALFLKAAFRLWQIRERRLGSFQEFLAAPSQWWPKAAAPRAPSTGLVQAGIQQRPTVQGGAARRPGGQPQRTGPRPATTHPGTGTRSHQRSPQGRPPPRPDPRKTRD